MIRLFADAEAELHEVNPRGKYSQWAKWAEDASADVISRGVWPGLTQTAMHWPGSQLTRSYLTLIHAREKAPEDMPVWMKNKGKALYEEHLSNLEALFGEEEAMRVHTENLLSLTIQLAVDRVRGEGILKQTVESGRNLWTKRESTPILKAWSSALKDTMDRQTRPGPNWELGAALQRAIEEVQASGNTVDTVPDPKAIQQAINWVTRVHLGGSGRAGSGLEDAVRQMQLRDNDPTHPKGERSFYEGFHIEYKKPDDIGPLPDAPRTADGTEVPWKLLGMKPNRNQILRDKAAEVLDLDDGRWQEVLTETLIRHQLQNKASNMLRRGYIRKHLESSESVEFGSVMRWILGPTNQKFKKDFGKLLPDLQLEGMSMMAWDMIHRSRRRREFDKTLKPQGILENRRALPEPKEAPHAEAATVPDYEPEGPPPLD